MTWLTRLEFESIPLGASRPADLTNSMQTLRVCLLLTLSAAAQISTTTAGRRAQSAEACPSSPSVGDCRGTKLRESPAHRCRHVKSVCACGSKEALSAAAAAAREPVPGTPNRVCAIVRTFAGHDRTLGTALQTLRASARAAGRPVAFEVHHVNTDPRPLPPCLLRSVALEAARNASDGFRLVARFDQTFARRGDDWKRRWRVGEDYGYVQTDLALLDLRKRKGCDFYHVTNGDNVYHVDFLRRHLDEHQGGAVITGVHFFSHLVAESRARSGGKYDFSRAKLEVGRIDLVRSRVQDFTLLDGVAGDRTLTRRRPRRWPWCSGGPTWTGRTRLLLSGVSSAGAGLPRGGGGPAAGRRAGSPSSRRTARWRNGLPSRSGAPARAQFTATGRSCSTCEVSYSSILVTASASGAPASLRLPVRAAPLSRRRSSRGSAAPRPRGA